MYGTDKEVDGPLTHIARTPLPWRIATKTVCGKPIANYPTERVVGLADAVAMQRRMGTQRFVLAICMTCAHNVGKWAEWDADPMRRMEREVTGGGFRKIEPIVEHELRAIAALIAAHRDEFDATVESYASGGIVSMSDLRKQRAAKAR